MSKVKETAPKKAVTNDAAVAAVSFSKEDVQLAVAMHMQFALQGSVDLLLSSGAAPSPEIGAVIMHLSLGVKHAAADVKVKAQSLMANPEGVERINMLQEIVRGPGK